MRSYFKDNYNRQRAYLLGALLLIIASLCIMNVRYSVEYTYRNHTAQMPDSDVQMHISAIVFAISDFIPVVTHLLLIWMAGKGQTDYLVCGFLYQPRESETSTYAGSFMLDELKADLSSRDSSIQKPFKSILLESEVMSLPTSGRLEKMRSLGLLDSVVFSPDRDSLCTPGKI